MPARVRTGSVRVRLLWSRGLTLPWKNKIAWLLLSMYFALVFLGDSLHMLPGYACSSVACCSVKSTETPKVCCSHGAHVHGKSHARPGSPQVKSRGSRHVALSSKMEARECGLCKMLSTLGMGVHCNLNEYFSGEFSNALAIRDQRDVAAPVVYFQSRAPPAI